jgi:hypothetical protein
VNGWFDQDCQTALDIRNEARMKMLQRGTRANALEYTDARKSLPIRQSFCHPVLCSLDTDSIVK